MGGSNNQESTTESSPWQPAQGHITGGLDWANQIVNNMATNVPQLGQLGTNGALNQAWGNMTGPGLGNLAGAMGTAGADLMGQMAGVGDIYKEIGAGPNMYNQQNYRDTMLADREGYFADSDAAIMNQLNDATANATGQIYGAAAGGGNVGSSRTQLASGQASGQLASSAHATMAGIRNQAFDTASAQGMQQEQQRLAALQAQAGGMMQAGQMGAGLMGQAGNIWQQNMNNQLQAGQGQLALEQQQLLTQYQNAMNQWQAPQNLVGWYSGLAQGAGSLGGTSTSTMTGGTDPFFSQMMGIAGSLGSAAILASDKRLKTNIKQISYDFVLDLPVYEWEWNKDIQKAIADGVLDENSWHNNTQGFIAQQVQEKYPEAVIETGIGDNWLMVDYEKLVETTADIRAANHGKIMGFKDNGWGWVDDPSLYTSDDKENS